MGTAYRELFKLYDLIQNGDASAVVKFLAATPTHINTIIPCKGIGVLHLAVGVDPEDKSRLCTEVLLKHGGDPNLCNDDGVTPVHIAAIWGRVDNMRLLVGCGGDVTLRDLDGLSAGDYAIQEQQWAVCDYLDNVVDQLYDSDLDCAYTLHLDKIVVTTDEVVAEYELINQEATANTTYRKSEIVRNWCENNSLVVNKLYPTILGETCFNPSILAETCLLENESEPWDENITLDLTTDTFKTCVSKRAEVEISGIHPLEATSKCTCDNNIRQSVYENFSIAGSPKLISHKNYNSKCSLRSKFVNDKINLINDSLISSDRSFDNRLIHYLNKLSVEEYKKTNGKLSDEFYKQKIDEYHRTNGKLSDEFNKQKIDEYHRTNGKLSDEFNKQKIDEYKKTNVKLIDELKQKIERCNRTNGKLSDEFNNQKIDECHRTSRKLSDEFNNQKIDECHRTSRKLSDELRPSSHDDAFRSRTKDSLISSDRSLDKAMAVVQNRTNESLCDKSMNTRRSSASSGVSSNYSGGSIVIASVHEEYKYQDKAEGVLLIEKRLLVSPVILPVDDASDGTPDQTVLSIASSLPTSVKYDDNTLRKELLRLGFNPGPILDTTRTLYLKKLQALKKNAPVVADKQEKAYSLELKKSLRSEVWMDNLTPYIELDKKVRADFTDPNKNWREGKSKTSFTYLLLDPRRTDNLPAKQSHTKIESWLTFVNSIFYVGKGKRSRPYAHLYQALTLWKSGFTTCNDKKIQHILDIWRSKVGVVCLHIFQNVIPAEAYTYEAAMIDVIGLSTLKNLKCGTYYGVAASWPLKERRMLGLYLLYKAMQIFINEGERQLRPDDI